MGFWKDLVEITYLVAVMIIILYEAIFFKTHVSIAEFTLLIALTGFVLAIIGYYLFEHFERNRADQ
jgi:Co/Zn/Cd efflux system component